MWLILIIIGVVILLLVVLFLLAIFVKKSIKESIFSKEGFYKKDNLDLRPRKIHIGSKKRKKGTSKVRGNQENSVEEDKSGSGGSGSLDEKGEEAKNRMANKLEEIRRKREAKNVSGDLNSAGVPGNPLIQQGGVKKTNIGQKTDKSPKDNSKKILKKRRESSPGTESTGTNIGEMIQQAAGKLGGKFSSGGMIKISNEKDIMKNIDNPKLKKVLEVLQLKNIIVFGKIEKSFENKQELEKFLIEGLIEYLKEKFEILKTKLSKLRKKGASVKMLEIEIMAITPKIKMFKATLNNVDLKKVLDLFEKAERDVSIIAQENKINLEE